MALVKDRQLIYPPCIRCNCPLITFFTDHRPRFVCIRCHEDMPTKGTRTVNPCTCGDIQTCGKCYERERCLRKRRRYREQYNKYQRDYALRNSDKIAAKDARYRSKRKAAQKAKEAERDAPDGTQH